MPHQPLIDGFEFASARATQQGILPLSGFPRLRDLLASDTGEVAYTVHGVRDEHGRPSLRLNVSGTLQLRCQRCLEALALEVETDELLVLAASRAEIDADPGDAESPDRLLAGKEMSVGELVEDELILVVPYAPRHESCVEQPETGKVKTLPFAGLRGLMRGRN